MMKLSHSRTCKNMFIELKTVSINEKSRPAFPSSSERSLSGQDIHYHSIPQIFPMSNVSGYLGATDGGLGLWRGCCS